MDDVLLHDGDDKFFTKAVRKIVGKNDREFPRGVFVDAFENMAEVGDDLVVVGAALLDDPIGFFLHG